MVDDDDVALSGAAAHFGNQAAVELLTLRADAAIGAGVELAPERACFGQLGQFGAVAGDCGLLPVADDLELADLFQSVQYRLVSEIVELLAAEIVGASFHVTDAQLAEVLREERNVFEI